MKGTSTSHTEKVAKLSIKDIEKVYESMTKPNKVLEKILMRPDYFNKIKEETPSTDISPIYGISVIVDPDLKVPFRFIYKKI